MIHRTERPLTEKEQKRLYRKCMTLQRRHKRSHNLRRHLIAGGIVFGLLWLATLLTADEPWWVITTFWLVVGSLITAQTVYTEHRKQLRFISAVRDALVRNVVEETSVTSNAMVELEEIEDLGACYAFQVEDGKIVFVGGQEFYPSTRFPNSDFSILEICDSAGKSVDF